MSISASAASSAFAIADELLNRNPRLSKLKLHKLLFFILNRPGFSGGSVYWFPIGCRLGCWAA